MNFEATFSAYIKRIETGIDSLLPASKARPARLHQAMRYSINAGGKRIRPVLCLAASELFPTEADPIPAAVAIECIHTYSLIHDDLPCVDDGVLRRGQPTCHREFDEATALLAGDALLTLAFQLIANGYSDAPQTATSLILELSRASGSKHLIGGQMEDIENENNPDASLEQLLWINENKTAALLSSSLVMGGIVGNGSRDDLANLRNLGHHAGLAFQVIDDVLDATSDEAALGKTTGADARHEKATFASVQGIDEARSTAQHHTQAARHICALLPGDSTFLHALVGHLEQRLH